MCTYLTYQVNYKDCASPLKLGGRVFLGGLVCRSQPSLHNPLIPTLPPLAWPPMCPLGEPSAEERHDATLVLNGVSNTQSAAQCKPVQYDHKVCHLHCKFNPKCGTRRNFARTHEGSNGRIPRVQTVTHWLKKLVAVLDRSTSKKNWVVQFVISATI